MRIGQQRDHRAVQVRRQCHAHLDGFDLHGRVALQARDRDRLEHVFRLKQPWHDGTHHLLFEPVELLEKLIALVPRPYTNLIVYHGVLAPNAKWRKKIVHYGKAELVATEKSSISRWKVNYTWAELMRGGLNIDAAACPACGETMKL